MARGKPTRGAGWTAFEMLIRRVEGPDIGFGVMLTTPNKPGWGF
jgi:hypothetical protein